MIEVGLFVDFVVPEDDHRESMSNSDWVSWWDPSEEAWEERQTRPSAHRAGVEYHTYYPCPFLLQLARSTAWREACVLSASTVDSQEQEQKCQHDIRKLQEHEFTGFGRGQIKKMSKSQFWQRSNFGSDVCTTLVVGKTELLLMVIVSWRDLEKECTNFSIEKKWELS